ncbi:MULTISPECIES: TRAP transporter substrate-binding protein [unclassified Psychrobacter]|uniref:TRAP transporter substrate-binding protein n=1 Tax=unclassified Psychrobacter TaxID=196806 RepID=UPI00071E8288|nr:MULTISPECIES: TRAP transporter substrate-binding protein [unclassified Psychrobacter]OLF38970.1 C4-dicarboxylate ABC transporter substrate-binding protein [Psychrobacter sp. Cmf 22.2]
MSIKVKLSAMSLTMALALGLSGCSNQADSTADGSATSAQETTTLRFSHFWPATSAMQTDVFEPWAEKLETESDGRLKVEIYPSATLSKPDATYDATAKGTIDIGSQAHGYTAGRFPLTTITELPGLSNSASQMSCILQTLYDDGTLAGEYEDTHLLFMMGAGPGALHTVDKLIRTPDDMKGMRIRRPSAVAGDIIEATGASPVGLPATDIYTSLQRGVIDGLSFAWSPTGDFRLTELTNAHTNIPFYSSALLVTMNKDKYQSLPDDLKKIIDDNSGKVMADIAGEMFDREDAKFIEEARAKGDQFIEIPDPLNDPAWKEPLEAGTQKYLDDVNALGLDADGVYEKAKAASAACKV